MAIQLDRANGTQNLNNNTGLHKSGQAATKHTQAQAGSEPGKQADSVSISQSARALQAVNQQDNQNTEVDQAKVEQLRQAIEDGSYKVDSQRLANKMLGFDAMF